MKILRIIASMNPEQGGPVEGLKRSSAILDTRGHINEVVTFDDPSAGYLKEISIPVHGCGPPRNGYGYTPLLTPWVHANADRFDVAIVHGLWNYSSFGAWRALRRKSLPYVVFTHGMLDPWFNQVQPVKRWAKQAYWTAIQGRILAGADRVLFTSEEERRLSRTAFWGHPYRERVVAYGSADVPGNALEQKTAFEALVPDLKGRNYLLFLSRIHPKKGCDLLVSAFAKIAAIHPDVDLVIAGPDQVGWRTQLDAIASEAGIRHRVHYPGMLKGDAKWGAFRDAQAFVLPSHQENFGIVVAEAMACGTPVLISDKVNIWREVEASGGGIVAPDTLDGTLKLMTDFLSLSAADLPAMRKKARAGYEASFGLDGAASDLEDILLKAIAGKSR